MGTNSVDLTLDLSSIYAAHETISELPKKPSVISDLSGRSSKPDYYLQIIEDELTKIHAFKRELPLSMLLLTNAIQRLKESMQSERTNEFQPATEEFIQLMGNSDTDGGAKFPSDLSDKKNWMSSAQLWTATSLKCQNCNHDINKNFSEFSPKSRETSEDESVTKTPSQSCNFKNREEGFMPSGLAMKEAAEVGLPEKQQGVLVLKPVAEIGSINLEFEGNSKQSDSSCVTEQMKPQSKLQQQRLKLQKKKQRRCWSPELHRRFVDALGQLGGAQTATPKHIRELMQVDSLTNDEVKSHLQKYRIHVRKQPESSTETSNGL